MKKFSELIRPKGSRSDSPDSGADTPEANVTRAIKAFCEAGKSKQSAPGPEGIDSTQVDEVTFLPTIVECTESSPTAAQAALNTIRKHVEYKNSKQGYQQYNALMLFRILVDNPGPTFTRGIDEKFVSTVKELYRNTRDPSVRQLLVENLEYCSKKDDQGLQLLKEWYAKEKDKAAKIYSGVNSQSRNAMGAYVGTSIPPPPQGGHHGHRSHRRSKHQLPPPDELAARISEAQTSAKLLMQILQSTPTSEVLSNQLITEFADRCSAASRSIQMFIEADTPAPPDESTMLTLFETNEQLATSLSKHQLAIFSAKKQSKSGEVSRTNSMNQVPQAQVDSQSPPPEGPTMSAPVHMNTTGPIPEPVTNAPNYGFSGFRPSQSPPLAETRPFAAPPPPIQTKPQTEENPFSDPEPARYQGWNSQPHEQQESSLYTTGRYTPSPVEHAPPAGQGRHPMADVSPVATNAPQMPHGYQPYRY
ncbi:hypothetical protein TWF106_005242 [Orbilia oligospora]|uniref:GAT domain-containing protein n=1 Tax=Orbilia oligospora TaxID=2813651 RepID=A0A6G1M1Y3_ORBOL|nr:hypothetical protein TWF106_005242 [Orbilia oligospora]KAF3204432.1 hypothetical protein TWF191_002264 [Orbilia oligospora]KAF3242214.1 hypothetical protein TWF192_008701 [Orbilia oligospora]